METDEAKERVEMELEELYKKIVSLTAFLFGRKFAAAGLSCMMKDCLDEQLRTMQRYAVILQRRLEIWGKSDEELNRKAIIGC